MLVRITLSFALSPFPPLVLGFTPARCREELGRRGGSRIRRLNNVCPAACPHGLIMVGAKKKVLGGGRVRGFEKRGGRGGNKHLINLIFLTLGLSCWKESGGRGHVVWQHHNSSEEVQGSTKASM